MKAAIFESFGAALEVKEVPMPLLGDSEILVRISACGVCYSDVKVWKGMTMNVPRLPFILGHEIAGTVTQVGSKVLNGVREGDRVLLYLQDTCDKCIYCRTGKDNECIDRHWLVGFNKAGGYAEYISVPAKDAVKIPANLAFVDAAPLADAGMTPYHAIVDKAQVRINETAVLIGIGGLALIGLQILKVIGANVIAVSRTQSKLDKARELGADLVVNSTAEDAVAAVRKFTGGLGADYVFDFVGSSETLSMDWNFVKREGKVLIPGFQEGGVQVSTLQINTAFANIVGTRAGTRQNVRDLVQLASKGKIKSIVTKTYPLEGANAALNSLAHGAIEGRQVLEIR